MTLLHGQFLVMNCTIKISSPPFKGGFAAVTPTFTSPSSDQLYSAKGRDVVEMPLVFSAMPAAVNTELEIDDEVQIERGAVSLLKYLLSVSRESCFFPMVFCYSQYCQGCIGWS